MYRSNETSWHCCSFWIKFLITFTCFLSNTLCFNLDAEFSTFYKGPQPASSFGYAVDLYSDPSESWIVVGAPKANINGEVYRCLYDSSLNVTEECELVPIVKERTNTAVKQRMGSTVIIGDGKNLLSCAPQFIHITSTSKAPFYDMIGICYFLEDFTLSKQITSISYKPCLDSIGTSHLGADHSNCQAGFCAAFTKDNKKILLGAVGSYYNQGSIFLVQGELAKNISSLPLHTNEFKIAKADIPQGWKREDYYRHTYDVNYMGYSVATGTTENDTTVLLTSAPRRLGYNLLGAITVYDVTLHYSLANYSGEQIAEGYGEGLAMVDLNGDNLDDIIVGSPLYSDFSRKEPEIGRIYIYYQLSGSNMAEENSKLVFSTPVIINGNQTMGRFGNTITSLGDVNNDNYNDILVSAPYERNNSDPSGNQYGALYVFNGGKDGIRTYPSQVIHGANLEKTPNFEAGRKIRGLGYSLKGDKDLDKNGYPDVVVGAFLSDQAVVIRARPVVKLVVESKILPAKVNLEALSCDSPSGKSKSACFEVTSCFSYTGKNVPTSVDISYSYDVDSSKLEKDKRAYLAKSTPRNKTLTSGDRDCVTETVYFTKDVKDKLSPIEVTVHYWLHETHQPVEPILDMLAGTSVSTQAEIFKDCGADDICVPKLKIESSTNPSKANIGEYTEVTMISTVSNEADNAYQTMLVVRYPQYSSFVGIKEDPTAKPVTCVDFNQTVMCEVANPLKKSPVTIQLKFGIIDLVGDIPTLTFESFANCTNEQSYTSSIVENHVQVTIQTNIQIYNVSQPSEIILEKAANLQANATDSKTVSHTYEITNQGPSVISNATISLLWPLRIGDTWLFPLDEVVTTGDISCQKTDILSKSELAKQEFLVPTDKPVDDSGTTNYYNCRTATKSCDEMTCTVGRMEPKTDVIITLKGELMLYPIQQSSLDSAVTSSLVFDITKYPYDIMPETDSKVFSEVSTLAVYPRVGTEPLPWWIIAVAIAAGVLFLLIIILIFWKCGFFKRKRKPQTEEDRQQQAKLCEEDDAMQKEMEEHLK